ncbi:hypothetical protein RRG08_025658 [Elysia crispata]|uniref:Uncharacterized protein n=1 Tax=Elysia crispata TaxID=231223 RepID=A0AAE1CXW9_9GAST|nr:hypothetical protein RRG08_025658 [Elysia crispata]
MRMSNGAHIYGNECSSTNLKQIYRGSLAYFSSLRSMFVDVSGHLAVVSSVLLSFFNLSVRQVLIGRG